MRIPSTTARRITLQILSVLIIVVVADYITDTSFPHHWIVFVLAFGLLTVLLVMYLALGPDS